MQPDERFEALPQHRPLGRRKSAELLMESRIAEAKNRAEASVLDADNQLKKAIAKIEAQKDIVKAIEKAGYKVTNSEIKKACCEEDCKKADKDKAAT